MDDIVHLQNMAKITLEQANQALKRQEWPAYGTYVKEYNRLLELTVNQYGDEVHQYLKPMDVPSSAHMNLLGMPELLSTVTLRLKELVAYLKVEEQK